MKNLLTCCLLMATLHPMLAQQQPWAPIGAHWYYCQGNGFGSPICGGYFYQEVEKDTIVQGVPCRKISGYQVDFQGVKTAIAPEFTWMQNDSVYYYNPFFQAFQLRYDFSASVGDTLTFPAPMVDNSWGLDDTTFQVRVDSITFITAGNESLRVFHLSQFPQNNNTDYWYFYGNRYTERIGGANRQTPFPVVTIPEIDGFVRCYADADLNIQLSQEDCDDVLSGWFGKDPIWHYGYYGFFIEKGFEIMTLEPSISFQFGHWAQKMTRTVKKSFLFTAGSIITTFLNPRYVYDENDRVYASTVWNNYVCLYDFNLEVGDSLTFDTDGCSEIVGYVILETGTMEIEGQNLRFQRARAFSPPYIPNEDLQMLIVERMGVVKMNITGNDLIPAGYFFLDEVFVCLADGPTRSFRCYSDATIPLYHISDEACDFVVDATAPENPLGFQITPNPSSEAWQINLLSDDSQPVDYQLLNIMGQVLQQGQLTASNQQISAQNLPLGAYWLKLNRGNAVAIEKCIKN
jgi:hypothetical protein